MTDLIKRFTIRIPFELYRRLEQSAKAERRSLNAQILFILDSYLNGGGNA